MLVISFMASLLGLVVGILNITAEETTGFMVAAIGLILSSTSIQQIPFVGETLTTIFSNIVVFISPALLVVAGKSLYASAKD